jgi:hypothetical protein
MNINLTSTYTLLTIPNMDERPECKNCLKTRMKRTSCTGEGVICVQDSRTVVLYEIFSGFSGAFYYREPVQECDHSTDFAPKLQKVFTSIF